MDDLPRLKLVLHGVYYSSFQKQPKQSCNYAIQTPSMFLWRPHITINRITMNIARGYCFGHTEVLVGKSTLDWVAHQYDSEWAALAKLTSGYSG
jgi:hypothetical protein